MSLVDSKNIILYGPPGTGKTYGTINKAVQIAEPDFDFSNKGRTEIKAEYDRLLSLGRIQNVDRCGFRKNFSKSSPSTGRPSATRPPFNSPELFF